MQVVSYSLSPSFQVLNYDFPKSWFDPEDYEELWNEVTEAPHHDKAVLGHGEREGICIHHSVRRCRYSSINILVVELCFTKFAAPVF